MGDDKILFLRHRLYGDFGHLITLINETNSKFMPKETMAYLKGRADELSNLLLFLDEASAAPETAEKGKKK